MKSGRCGQGQVCSGPMRVLREARFAVSQGLCLRRPPTSLMDRTGPPQPAMTPAILSTSPISVAESPPAWHSRRLEVLLGQRQRHLNVPAHQGMKRRSCGLVHAKNWHFGGFCYAPPRPQRGTSPRATAGVSDRTRRPLPGSFSFRRRPSVYNSARFAGGEPALRFGGRLEGTSRIGVRDMLS